MMPNAPNQGAGSGDWDDSELCQKRLPVNDDFDLSFAIAYHWDRPESQIREALHVLLFNEPSESQEPDESDVRTQTKRRSAQSDAVRQAALEAARIRWLLAINPNTPPPVLDHLTTEAPPPLLERIAEHPRADISTLARLSNHPDPQVRAAVAENMNAPIKTIWKLVRDESADVRWRLAESYTVPIAVLKVLAEDENPYVAQRARSTVLRILREVTDLRTA